MASRVSMRVGRLYGSRRRTATPAARQSPSQARNGRVTVNSLFHKPTCCLGDNSADSIKQILTLLWPFVDNGSAEGIIVVSVLVIRSHKRFAVRRPVNLCEDDGDRRGGLMIELSGEGCRISGVDSLHYTIDQKVTLDLGDEERPGWVRWAHDGFVGIKFAAALRQAELNQWLATSRMAPELCYGT